MLIFLMKRWRQNLAKLRNHFLFYKHFKSFPPATCTILGIDGITIGRNFSLGENCELYARRSPSQNAQIQIGSDVALNSNVILNAECGGSIKIGNNVLIGPGVMMRASNHNFRDPKVPIKKQGHSPGEIAIGENVWIGANVTILPNISIGNNSVIAAGSIITKDVPENSIFIQKRESHRADLF